MVKGQRLRVRTINFDVDWPDIRTQMLDLLRDTPLVGRVQRAGVQATAAN